jgi:hypothetical protein
VTKVHKYKIQTGMVGTVKKHVVLFIAIPVVSNTGTGTYLEHFLEIVIQVN